MTETTNNSESPFIPSEISISCFRFLLVWLPACEAPPPQPSSATRKAGSCLFLPRVIWLLLVLVYRPPFCPWSSLLFGAWSLLSFPSLELYFLWTGLSIKDRCGEYLIILGAIELKRSKPFICYFVSLIKEVAGWFDKWTQVPIRAIIKTSLTQTHAL